MNTAKKLAKSKIKIVELSTATNNKKAQALYRILITKETKNIILIFLNYNKI